MKRPDDGFALAVGSMMAIRIEELRRSQEPAWTQVKLANASGLTKASISAIESGKQGISVATLCRLALAFQIEPTEMLPDLQNLRDIVDSTLKGSAAALTEEFISKLDGEKV